MVREITLRQAGGSVTATLPKDIADRLNVRAGDRVYVVETDQGVLLTPYDPSFGEALEAFDEVRRDYRNTLRKLAE
jgi:antitoxin MazE